MQRRKEMQSKVVRQEQSASQLQPMIGVEDQQASGKLNNFDKGLPHVQSLDRLSSASNFQFGRSIQSGYHQSRQARPDSQQLLNNQYTIRTYERVFSAFPQKKAANACLLMCCFSVLFARYFTDDCTEEIVRISILAFQKCIVQTFQGCQLWLMHIQMHSME